MNNMEERLDSGPEEESFDEEDKGDAINWDFQIVFGWIKYNNYK